MNLTQARFDELMDGLEQAALKLEPEALTSGLALLQQWSVTRTEQGPDTLLRHVRHRLTHFAGLCQLFERSLGEAFRAQAAGDGHAGYGRKPATTQPLLMRAYG